MDGYSSSSAGLWCGPGFCAAARSLELFRESSLLLVTSVSLKEVLPNVTSVVTRNFTVKLLSSAQQQQKNKVQRTGPSSEARGRNDNVL